MRLTAIVPTFAVTLAAALATSSQQQNPSTAATQACGPQTSHFSLNADDSKAVADGPLRGSSRLIVFSENISPPVACDHSLIRVGMDGEWLGATCPGSYISVDIPPGEHHLCANLQGAKTIAFTALHHLNIGAGQTMFFRAQLIAANVYGSNSTLHLDHVDEDEGKLLMGTRTRSISSATNKK